MVAIQSGGGAASNQRHLGGIAAPGLIHPADVAAVFRPVHIVAKNAHPQDRFEVGAPVQRNRLPAGAKYRGVALPDHVDIAGRQCHPAHDHAVFRERAGLVGEDDRRRAQRFHGRQLLDQCIAPRHAPHAAAERHGGDDGQSFRNGGDGENDGGLDHQEQFLAGEDAGPGHHHANGDHHVDQFLAEPLQTPLQRRRLVFRPLHQRRNPADFGIHAGGDNDALAPAPRHRSAAEHHIGSVRQRRIVLVDGIRDLVHRHRFTGQGGFVGLKIFGGEQPQIGGHHLALR